MIQRPSFAMVTVFRLSLLLNIIMVIALFWRDPIMGYMMQNTSSLWLVEKIFNPDWYKSYFKTGESNKEDALLSYQMMKDIHELLLKNKIAYWADGGTLLGVVRHRGQIPWDTDLDIAISFEDALRFQKLQPEMEALGYSLAETFYGYTLSLDPLKTSIKFSGICRIYLTFTDNGARPYASLQARAMWPKNIQEKDLVPLVLAPFGQIKIQIPNNPVPYLNQLYGDWQNIAYRGRGQMAESLPPSAPFVLSPEHLNPAQPTGPLKDRVKP